MTTLEFVSLEPSSNFGPMVDNVSVVRSAPSIPTVSEWGLIVMMLLILTAGSIVFMRRSQHQVA